MGRFLKIMATLFILLFVGFCVTLMAIPPEQVGVFGDHVVCPKNLPSLVGNPVKLKLAVSESTNNNGILRVSAEDSTGLALTLERSTVLDSSRTRLKISKTGWIGYMVFNFEGPVIRSLLLGNGMVIPPERLRGETRALAGRLFQRLYELGLNATREPQPLSD